MDDNADIRNLFRAAAHAPARDITMSSISARVRQRRRRRRALYGALTVAAVSVASGLLLNWPAPSVQFVDDPPAPAPTEPQADGISSTFPLPSPGDVAAEHLDDGTPVFVTHSDAGEVSVIDAADPHESTGHVDVYLAYCTEEESFSAGQSYPTYDVAGRWIDGGGDPDHGAAVYDSEVRENLVVVTGPSQVASGRGQHPSTDEAGRIDGDCGTFMPSGGDLSQDQEVLSHWPGTEDVWPMDDLTEQDEQGLQMVAGRIERVGLGLRGCVEPETQGAACDADDAVAFTPTEVLNLEPRMSYNEVVGLQGVFEVAWDGDQAELLAVLPLTTGIWAEDPDVASRQEHGMLRANPSDPTTALFASNGDEVVLEVGPMTEIQAGQELGDGSDDWREVIEPEEFHNVLPSLPAEGIGAYVDFDATDGGVIRISESRIPTTPEPASASGTFPLPDEGTVTPEFLDDGTPVYLVNDERLDEVAVLDPRDPHWSIGPHKLVAWCASSGMFEDVHHGSRFAVDGAYAAGPAPFGLRPFEVAVDDGTVLVGDVLPAAPRPLEDPAVLGNVGPTCVDDEEGDYIHHFQHEIDEPATPEEAFGEPETPTVVYGVLYQLGDDEARICDVDDAVDGRECPENAIPAQLPSTEHVPWDTGPTGYPGHFLVQAENSELMVSYSLAVPLDPHATP